MAFDVIQADVIAHLRGNQWLVQNGHIPKAHAVLCDPPYGLEFMGKEWDKPKPSGLFHVPADENRTFSNASGHFFDNMKKPIVRYTAGVHFQAWVTEWATLLLDYVYPGALLMAFGGTRTYHRLAAGLEDAGWEIGDSMAWVYGQGFPKSHSLEKATGDSHWAGFGSALKPSYEPVVIARAPRGNHTYAALAREFGTGALAIDAGRIGTDLISNHDGGVNHDGRKYGGGKGIPAIERGAYTNTGRWPANFGLVCTCEGDDHADDCPVKVLGEQSGTLSSGKRAAGQRLNSDTGWRIGTSGNEASVGDASRFFYQAKASAWEREAGLHDRARRNVNPGHNLSTNACARCGKRVKANGSGDKCECGDLRETVKVSDRANVHPTVKPIRLAEYLARLILPPVLDEPRRLLIPFAGSGSEMVGALLAGWDIVTGIERESEYVELARARVGWWAQFSTYDEARAAYEKGRKAQPVAVVVDADDKPTQRALFDERTG